MVDVEKPRHRKSTAIEVFSPEEVMALVRAAASEQDAAIYLTAAFTGLRRGELLALDLESLQQREEHWVIADLLGKGGHVRTVPVPAWVKDTVDAWVTAAGIAHGRVFRAINKAGHVWGDGMTPKVIWELVKAAAAHADIEKLAPHDLRRHAGCRLMPTRRRPRGRRRWVACMRPIASRHNHRFSRKPSRWSSGW